MISRRLLRTKALQVIYAYYLSDQPNTLKSEKELLFSVEKTYELYHYLLLLLVDLAEYAESRMNVSKAKYFPTAEEVNPNTRFISNPVIHAIRDSTDFNKYLDTRKISWVNNPELVKKFHSQLLDDPAYHDYMDQPETSFKHHRNIILHLLSEIIVPSELFSQILEEKSIYWNDDLEFAGTMALKTIDGSKENQNLRLFPMYKNTEDKHFMIDLFRKSILKSEETRELINKFADNWEFERIALMDIFIMQMALTEAMEFPSIPTKVTFNEFIEISKFYSTEKSSTFINGILDKAFHYLKAENKIKKTGRGLIGEVDS